MLQTLLSAISIFWGPEGQVIELKKFKLPLFERRVTDCNNCLFLI